jgi:hypothetical protein
MAKGAAVRAMILPRAIRKSPPELLGDCRGIYEASGIAACPPKLLS